MTSDRVQDEGIVQPISKEMEQLSRRLHQCPSGLATRRDALEGFHQGKGMPYKETRELAAADAAYIAGLVDGEGTITLSRRHAQEHRQLVVSIANTERRLLDFVLECVGAGKITRKRTAAAHHTPSYCYSIANRQALALVAQLQPYLRSHKRDRASLILSIYLRLTPRNGKYTAAMEQDRRAFEQRFFAITSTGSLLTETSPSTSPAAARRPPRLRW